ncbi:Tir3p PWA37_000339 [Arxiozyma heterogenica]|uniref:Tir3p n=1 Tax=Arxiozyma heterogenica TaxID=278026 RepID=UPI002F0C0C12
MSVKKFLALMAGAATLTSALDAYEVAEFDALLLDVNAHLTEYISLAENNPSFTIPEGVLECYTHITTYTDDSYTTLFTMINFAQVTTAMELLPWYSSRIVPLMSSYFKAHSITETADLGASGASGSSATASASSSSESVATTTSSASASSSSKSSKSSASSSSASKSSTSKSSSSATASSSSKDSSSSKSSSSASATSTKSKSANGANLLTAGMGAAAMGAAALLL